MQDSRLRPRRVASSLWLLVLTAGLAACVTSPLADKLSYAQVQSLNPGVSADWVFAEYPNAIVDRGPGGAIRSLRYAVEDPHGGDQSLVLRFDEAGRLVKKDYSGRVLRPPTDP